MSLKVLADESVDFRIVKSLMDAGFDVVSVLKNYQGVSDKNVLELARHLNALLLTEDSDFGEWIFAHKEKDVSVIFLRYKAPEMEDISNSLKRILFEYNTSLHGKFAVITVKKIRIREVI